jgi:hypothetical protein
MNLENLNLVELDAREVKETEGGLPTNWTPWGIVAAVLWSAWDNASDFGDGYAAGHAAYHK